ncbi:MAG: 50S ribosomal protein L6 [Candidatus Pacearchaeota archaeon]|nr:50S ribosomal protein L6 [Candidatus Pacearchaeota archaeon]
MKKEIKKVIEIPPDIDIEITGNNVIVKGPLGECKRSFKFYDIEIKKENGKIILRKDKGTKKSKKMINSIAAHIRNMLGGVKKKYEYILEICSVHFPMNVKVEENKIIVKNFLGERKDRIIELLPGVEIEVEGNKIFVRSIDKELAGKQASLIENISRNIPRDRRIFQDGIWIIKKEKGARR